MLKMEVTIWLNHFNIEESALQEEIPIFLWIWTMVYNNLKN